MSERRLSLCRSHKRALQSWGSAPKTSARSENHEANAGPKPTQSAGRPSAQVQTRDPNEGSSWDGRELKSGGFHILLPTAQSPISKFLLVSHLRQKVQRILEVLGFRRHGYGERVPKTTLSNRDQFGASLRQIIGLLDKSQNKPFGFNEMCCQRALHELFVTPEQLVLPSTFFGRLTFPVLSTSCIVTPSPELLLSSIWISLRVLRDVGESPDNNARLLADWTSQLSARSRKLGNPASSVVLRVSRCVQFAAPRSCSAAAAALTHDHVWS